MRLFNILVSICYTATIQAASIRMKKRDVCNDASIGYFITPETTTGDQALAYCQSLGGKLADVDTNNLAFLTAFTKDCLGPNSHVRVQTWDTNTFGISLAMFTGPLSGFGTVNTASNGEALYALCAMTHDDTSFTTPTPTPGTVNNAFLVDANRIQIPDEEEDDDEEEVVYNLVQE